MKSNRSSNSGDLADPLPRTDALWALLGQTKPVEVSPFFARNVLREIRLSQKPSPTQWVRRLLHRWRMAAVAAAALCVVGSNFSVLLQDYDSSTQAQYADADQTSSIDDLLAYEPSSDCLSRSTD